MSDLIITNDNYLEYLYTRDVAAKTFVKALKGLCNVAPEFTREPRMKIFNDGLLYKSNYSYGKFTARLSFAFFCFDEEKLCDYDVLVFDLKSFGIKPASSKQVKNACGETPPWYDPERKLSDETKEMIEQYFRIRESLGDTK